MRGRRRDRRRQPRRGDARPVADDYAGRFELGLHYRHCGRGLSLEAATSGSTRRLHPATDRDDRRRLRARRVMVDRVARHAAAHRRRRRVGSSRALAPAKGTPAGSSISRSSSRVSPSTNRMLRSSFASTHNSMPSSDCRRRRAEHRFQPSPGRLGGEDMVFYRSAHRLGLPRLRIAGRAGVRGRARRAPELSVQAPSGALARQQLDVSPTSMAPRTTRLRFVVHGVAVAAGRGPSRAAGESRSVTPAAVQRSAGSRGCRRAGSGTIGVRIRHHWTTSLRQVSSAQARPGRRPSACGVGDEVVPQAWVDLEVVEIGERCGCDRPVAAVALDEGRQAGAERRRGRGMGSVRARGPRRSRRITVDVGVERSEHTSSMPSTSSLTNTTSAGPSPDHAAASRVPRLIVSNT